jgi:hypothetical protein
MHVVCKNSFQRKIIYIHHSVAPPLSLYNFNLAVAASSLPNMVLLAGASGVTTATVAAVESPVVCRQFEEKRRRLLLKLVYLRDKLENLETL